LEELEKGIWNFGGRKFKPPKKKAGDVEVSVRMWKSLWEGWNDYRLRLSDNCIIRINRKNVIKETAQYKAVISCNVTGTNCLDLYFDTAKTRGNAKYWTLHPANEDALQLFVYSLHAKAGYDPDRAEQLAVTFEEGVEEFDYKDAVLGRFEGKEFGADSSGASASSRNKADPWGLENPEDDAFADELMEHLTFIQDVSKETGNVLQQHQYELEKQQNISNKTSDRVQKQKEFAYRVDRKIGGKGEKKEKIMPSSSDIALGAAKSAVGM